MSFIGNLFWLILGGLLTAVLYIIAGILLCITIIGIPFGFQLMKFGMFALAPFGHEVKVKEDFGCLALIFNIIWILLGWWEIAIIHVVCGLIFCITIIGIPLGVQHFKMAFYSLMPFGREIV
ncbi:MAG: YccF domain-containing protein [Candidatus Cryptobacteroides sp.]|nr:YccF domain-containing protein [Candidatus Cryptobacteroides sp.]